MDTDRTGPAESGRNNEQELKQESMLPVRAGRQSDASISQTMPQNTGRLTHAARRHFLAVTRLFANNDKNLQP